MSIIQNPSQAGNITEREIAIIEDHRERWMARAFRAETERDAARAALERVRAIHVESDWKCGNPRHTNPKVGCPECYTECETCDRTYPCATVAALDGAPEPEWEEHINYGAERTDGSVAYEPRGRNYATHQQVARFGPWEPVGGEQP